MELRSKSRLVDISCAFTIVLILSLANLQSDISENAVGLATQGIQLPTLHTPDTERLPRSGIDGHANALREGPAVNLHGSQNVELVGLYDTPGQALGVYVAGGYAYVADGEFGLRIVDISDPTTPQEVGSYDTPGTASDVFVAQNYAYVADREAGLQVVDISSPTTPRGVGSYDTTGLVWSVYVIDRYAYLADGGPGLLIVSISNPFYPNEVSRYNTSGYALDVYVFRGFIYVADGKQGGLRVLDMVPHEKGFYDTPGYARGVFVAGNYAYMADGGEGLRVVDISNPFLPREVGFYDTPGNTRYGYADGNRVYVAALAAGLRIVDVSDPTSPHEVGFYNTPGQASDVFLVETYAYVADGDDGLLILRYTGQAPRTPTATATTAATPTPQPTAIPTPTVTSSVTPTADLCHDAYEPNDSQGEATLLTSGQIIQALICPETDRDIYALDVSTLDPFIVEMTGLEPETGFDMWLYDPDGTPLVGSTNPGNADEHIEYTPARTGIYYLMVFRPEAAPANTGPYTLNYDLAENHLPGAKVYLPLVRRN